MVSVGEDMKGSAILHCDFLRWESQISVVVDVDVGVDEAKALAEALYWYLLLGPWQVSHRVTWQQAVGLSYLAVHGGT